MDESLHTRVHDLSMQILYFNKKQNALQTYFILFKFLSLVVVVIQSLSHLHRSSSALLLDVLGWDLPFPASPGVMSGEVEGQSGGRDG